MGWTLHAMNTIYTTRHTDPALLPRVKAPADELKGTEIGKDGKSYRVWWVLNPRPGVQPGKYLVDESLDARELVDPGIGGRITEDADGNELTKFTPAQPQLFATLIQGIMARDLPWGLIIIGAVLAIVMQLCGVSALAFAVGVYLPLSTTLPIFVGGMVRKVVDKARRFTDEEADMSPSTLMSTGLIAGGSLAGMCGASLVYCGGLKKRLDFSKLTAGSETYWISVIMENLPLIAFSIMVAVLLAVGFSGRRPVPSAATEPGDKPQLGEIGED